MFRIFRHATRLFRLGVRLDLDSRFFAVLVPGSASVGDVGCTWVAVGAASPSCAFSVMSSLLIVLLCDVFDVCPDAPAMELAANFHRQYRIVATWTIQLMPAKNKTHANQVMSAVGPFGTQTPPSRYDTPVMGREMARKTSGRPTPNVVAMMANSLVRLKLAMIRSATVWRLVVSITR